MTEAEKIDREAEAFYLRDNPVVDGSPTVKQIYTLGLRRGIQIQRNVELDQRIDATLAKIDSVSPTGARVI